MKLFIPEIGTKLKLTEDWNFVLYEEYRNEKMFKAIGKTFTSNYRSSTPPTNHIVKIPADTILNIDRVYIRKGVSDFSSITFTISKKENKKHKFAGTRFWVKLSDVNEIHYELVSCNEKTMALIHEIDEKTKMCMESIDQSKFMKLILDGNTVNNVRPQELPSHFINKVISAIKEFNVSKKVVRNYELEHELFSFIRAHKIASFLYEDDDVQI